VRIPRDEIWSAHAEAKTALLHEIRRTTSQNLAPDCLTIGFARRATAYKRADLVFFDPARLVEIASQVGRLQFVFAGKAHPKDEPGKEMIRRIFEAAKALAGRVTVVYLENYDLELARLLTSGVDLWLNTPLRPLEASGTSGMKAAHNGIPSLSVLDGWWIEGHMEGVTGWSIGEDLDDGLVPADEANRADAFRLYEKLTDVIVPLYYDDRDGWIDVMRRTIAFNASFFNTHRMVQQYAANAYV
jgi:starch phosphorylase